MKNIYLEIVRVLNARTPAALATIIKVKGSSPRGLGAKFLVPKDSPTIGSVGGGCLEAEVWQGSMDAMKRGKNALMNFQLDDENMVDSGLICGGAVTILIEPLHHHDFSQIDIYQRIKEMRDQGERGVLASVVSRGGSAVPPRGSKVLFGKGEEKRGFLLEGAVFENEIRHWCVENILKELRLESFKGNDNDPVEILLEPIQPDSTLYIFGAGHIAEALLPLGKMADFRVVVIDDRTMFANPKRFPEADEILVEPFEMVFDKLQINPHSYLVIVTRGHLYDGEVLERATKTDAGYIGMIGSKRKIAVLYKTLQDKGVKKEALDRVYAPIGLDIHSETPAEIAISIAAELIQIRVEGLRRTND